MYFEGYGVGYTSASKGVVVLVKTSGNMEMQVEGVGLEESLDKVGSRRRHVIIVG